VALGSDITKSDIGQIRLGIIKFFLPKWSRYFVHMFSVEEGTTEFASMPKAVKEVNSWAIKGSISGVDLSRIDSDRVWIGESHFSKVTLLSDQHLWERPEMTSMVDEPLEDKDWRKCSECQYLIDTGETFTECKCCHKPYHSDCLFPYEKKSGRGYDPVALDRDARRYRAAAQKWNSRKVSKKSTVIIDESELSDAEDTPVLDAPSDKFICNHCRECRFCCGRLEDAIIPSSTTQSIEPFVTCIKCNTSAHGHCVFPPVPKLHSSVQWVCDECRECNSCGRVTYLNESTGLPSLLTDWALPWFDQCRTCFAGLDKGEYCPVCMKAWSVEWGGDMVQCDACEFWVHVSCDDLGSVNLSKLEKDGVKYTCPICRDSTDVHRRRRVIDLLRAIDKVALFSEPVSADFMPVYLKVIKNPMDLSRMKKKNYATNLEFIKDFELIVDNAKVFNMPNSPAYRLAEQFHKQGKLLIEKYLLVERKGASKIEGLTVEVEDPLGGNPSDPSETAKRAASLLAEKMWKRENQQPSSGGRRKLTYEQALEMIKRSTPAPTAPYETPSAGPQPSGTISPYKRRLSHPKLGLLSPAICSPLDAGSTTKPSSGMVTPAATLSEEEIERTVAKVFGFRSLVFLRNKFRLFVEDERCWNPHPLVLKSNFDRILSGKLKPDEIASDARWTLFDVCSTCGSYGEPWNFVECNDCGECFHWFCCGLVGNPNENVVAKHANPLFRTPEKKSSFRFTCKSCADCRYCHKRSGTSPGGRLAACCLCGSMAHSECRTQYFTSHELNPNMFRLNFSIETGFMATPATGLPVCEDCVMSQALRFFKAETCKKCDSLINPNVASCYFRSMPEGAPPAVSGRPSPLVHCIACGDVWHARCIPEFGDVSSADILGVYVCSSCVDGIAPLIHSKALADERSLQEECLASMSQVLKEYRPNSYKEVQVDFTLEALRNAGFSFTDRDSRLLWDLVDVFQGPSANEYAGQFLRLSEKEREWIEWGFMHKDFLVGLGNPVLELSKKKTSIDNNASVRVKRVEDEDLILVKRLHSAYSLVQGILSKSEQHVSDDVTDMDYKEDANMVGLSTLSEFPDRLGALQSPREYLTVGSELGARLLQVWWIHGMSGYIGPRVFLRRSNGIMCISDHGLPAWEERRCKLCGVMGDHVSFGIMISVPRSGWVHTECIAWSLPDASWVESVELTRARPQRDHMGPHEFEEPPPKTLRSIPVGLVKDLIDSGSNTVCAVCDKVGATVLCQSCHSASSFHLPCALSVNGIATSSSSDSRRVLMDSRCRMLTCGKCLYRHPDTERYFVQQFASSISNLKSSQSALNQVWALRHQSGLVVNVSDEPPLASIDPGHVVREGTVSIINPGQFDDTYVYDGAGPITPGGYVALRIFWQVDLTLTPEDELNGVRITLNQREIPKLRRRRRGAYLCKISKDCKVYTIQFVAGRVVAIGGSLAEVWSEFKSFLIGEDIEIPPFMTGEWFFGLTCKFMKSYLSQVALKSVKRQAGLHRDRWLYQPQLREYVTEALGLKSDLKPVSSMRRNLTCKISSFKENIDQLKNLGREPVPSSDSREALEVLEPALVICEYSGNGEDVSVTATKPSRAKSGSALGDMAVTGDMSTRYKVRSLIPDEKVLSVQRSKIHNYGLFARNGFSKGDLVVEYQGEVLRQTIADEREKKAERAGDGDGGSCYMFKLDDDYVVDATVKGNCSRFINHSCNPNCSCKMVEDENRLKHIMIIAKRDVMPGEEITYDYQFAVESEKLACLCGAPNCLGRLN
jgi:hypothetical protein